MMDRKRFFGTALAVMMALSLTACGNNQNGTTPNNGVTNTPAPQTTHSAAPGVTNTPGTSTTAPDGGTASVRSTDMSRTDTGYYAGNDGYVRDNGSGYDLAQGAERAVDRTGNALRDAAGDVARGTRDVVDDLTGR